MAIAVVTKEAAELVALQQLGVHGRTITSTEGLSESLRRAASFLCPAPRRRIVDSVENVLAPFTEQDRPLRQELDELVDLLIGYGDLVEGTVDGDAGRQTLIYLGPPRFATRQDGTHLLIGVRPDAQPLVGNDLDAATSHLGHTRSLDIDDDPTSALIGYGLDHVNLDRWLRAPDEEPAPDLVARYDRLLSTQPPAGDTTETKMLDPTTSVDFYRGRWRAPKPSDTGKFIARRPQAYGADLWCYADFGGGVMERFIDLPLSTTQRGCDEAWRLQAAIDRERGVPQQLRAHGSGSGSVSLGLQCPPPRWLQHRWDLFGVRTALPRSLFAYSFRVRAVREEIEFVSKMLWLDVRPTKDD